jgi:hypothetical protein
MKKPNISDELEIEVIIRTRKNRKALQWHAYVEIIIVPFPKNKVNRQYNINDN